MRFGIRPDIIRERTEPECGNRENVFRSQKQGPCHFPRRYSNRRSLLEPQVRCPALAVRL